MEMNPAQQVQPQEQMPLLLSGVEEIEKLAKELSLEDKTISGSDYGKLYKRAIEFGISNTEVDKILSELGIRIDSKLPPEEPRPNIHFH